MAATDEEVFAIMRWLFGELKEDSAEELEARRIFARVLRHEPLDMCIRISLSHLIDPDMKTTMNQWLAFRRQRGRPKMDSQKVAMIVHEARKNGKRMKEALTLVAEQCGVTSRDKVYAACKLWQPFFDKKYKR